MATTSKAGNFQTVPCPGCGTNYKVVRGQIQDIKAQCPNCNGTSAPAEAPADNTLAINAKSLGKLQAEVQRQGAAIQSLKSDLKSILNMLSKESTALNDDVPASTKRRGPAKAAKRKARTNGAAEAHV